MNESQTLVAIASFIPFGPVRLTLLLNYFASAKKIWKADSKTLLKVGLKENLVQGFKEHRTNFNEEKYFNELSRLKIDTLSIKDKDYPKNLKKLGGAPIVLYIKGNKEVLGRKMVAIVGSRKMTYYGREVTEKFVEGLSAAGVGIISGLARGIDTASHKAALKFGGFTVGVLGCGPQEVYPRENTILAKEIIEKGGAVISEYPLGYPALPKNFPNRNRIVSGLSEAVIVVEGAEKSGTLLTASHAADQGKTVFAVPGQITSPLSAAPHYLIKNGAKFATTASDILEELGWQNIIENNELKKVVPDSPEEEKILQFLENEPLHLDELARISSLAPSLISSKLIVMEIKGMVKNIGGGVYRKI